MWRRSVESASLAGTYMTVDSTCGNAPVTFELVANADGSLTYAQCRGSDCTPDHVEMRDDGAGSFSGSAAYTFCATDNECGCMRGFANYESDVVMPKSANTIDVSLGRTQAALGTTCTTQLPATQPPYQWCDFTATLQP